MESVKLNTVSTVDAVCNALESDILSLRFAPGEKAYELHGKSITSIEEFINEIVNMELSEIEQLTADPRLMAWLYSIGYKDDVLKFFEL